MPIKLGVVIEDTWAFFDHVYADLSQHYQTEVFERKKYSPFVFRSYLNNYSFKRDLNAFLQANDVVFFEWSSGLLAAASQLNKSCGVVTRLHRFELYHWADKINWDFVDKIILVSRAKEREFTAIYPSQASKIIVIPEAISLTKFRPQVKDFNGDIGILGDLIPRKRFYELILAFYELIQQDNRFHLHIGGGREEKFKDYYLVLHELVKKLNIMDKVTFYDKVNEPQNWFKQIDIFISNSYSEGLQVSPIEAMACGCYCLSHQWDGADELLPEENLYFTNADLNDKILRFANLPVSQKQLERDTLQAIVRDKFDVRKISEQICQVVADVASLNDLKSI